MCLLPLRSRWVWTLDRSGPADLDRAVELPLFCVFCRGAIEVFFLAQVLVGSRNPSEDIPVMPAWLRVSAGDWVNRDTMRRKRKLYHGKGSRPLSCDI